MSEGSPIAWRPFSSEELRDAITIIYTFGLRVEKVTTHPRIATPERGSVITITYHPIISIKERPITVGPAWRTTRHRRLGPTVHRAMHTHLRGCLRGGPTDVARVVVDGEPDGEAKWFFKTPQHHHHPDGRVTTSLYVAQHTTGAAIVVLDEEDA